MMRIGRFNKAVLLLAGVLWFSAEASISAAAPPVTGDAPVAEQKAIPGDTEGDTEVSPTTWTGDGILAGEPERIRPDHPPVAYTKDTFFSRTMLQGIFSGSELYFYIPQYWETEYIYVQLEYEVSQLVQGLASSMTFSVNNMPVSSCRLTYDKRGTQTAYVEIPTELVKEGYNSFTISGYARLYDEEGCVDDYSNANWLAISDHSYIRCGYDTKPHKHRINAWPYPFMSTLRETGRGLTIAVSDRATDAEVAAAMNLMADLAAETGEQNHIQFALLSDVRYTGAERMVVVSEYENLPEEYRSRLSVEDELDDMAVIEFTDDAKGNPLLIVTSDNPDCLLDAAYMLMDDERVSQETGRIARVKEADEETAGYYETAVQGAAGNYTLEDLAGGGLTYAGPFRQEQTVYLPASEGYYLAAGGKAALSFRYSENLDFGRSLVSVYWGEVPVASKKLEKEKASGDELVFSMPSDVEGTGAGSIRIVFDLEIQDLVCTARQDQMPWAYVLGESSFYLPVSVERMPSFDLKTSLFCKDDMFDDLLLVISDEPSTEELNLYAQLIGLYGKNAAPYGTLLVKRAGEFTESDADYHMITAGTPQNNRVLKLLNDRLYFSYDEGGKSFNSSDQLILSGQYAKEAAIFQLLESPFADNRSVLAVTYVTKEARKNAESVLRSDKLRSDLSKDCVLIGPQLDMKAYRFIRTDSDEEAPTLAGMLVQNKQSVLFTVVATSVMLILLIAVIIILIRIRMYRRKKDEE